MSKPNSPTTTNVVEDNKPVFILSEEQEQEQLEDQNINSPSYHHEHKQDNSVLAVLSNARSAAKSARGPLLSTAPYGSKIPSNNSNNNMRAQMFATMKEQVQYENDQTLLKDADTHVSDMMKQRLMKMSGRGGAVPGNNNINNNSSSERPLSVLHISIKQAREHQLMIEQQEVSKEDAEWFQFVEHVSLREKTAADRAASMKIDDIDEHGQLESDFLSGLDEETWDFDADLFANADLHQKESSSSSSLASFRSNKNSGNNKEKEKLATSTSIVNSSDFATPELRKQHAERTTFWTLRRIIEKLQHRVKSVVQQRDAYKTLLGRYSHVASELHSAAKRCDAATTILSDRYNRVVKSEMSTRANSIAPPYPPGTVLFGNAQSQQGKEIKMNHSFASFDYPVDGFTAFEVQPQMVDPDTQKSIVTSQQATRKNSAAYYPSPQSIGQQNNSSNKTQTVSFGAGGSGSSSGDGLGVPARGVDWQIVGEMEKDAANVISVTHDNELKHLSDQLAASFRRHNRDVKTVATMRRGVSDALDHCRYLESVILEKENEIARLHGEVDTRDKAIVVEQQKASDLRKQIEDLMRIRYELDEELGKAGDNEHDLGERLQELKKMITEATQRSEREAIQRREEGVRLRTTMQEFTREFEGTVSIWKQQWKDVNITGKANQQNLKKDKNDGDNNNNNNNNNNDNSSDDDQEHKNHNEEDDPDAISSDFMKQVLEMKNKQKLDFLTQWQALIEMFEQKRVDLSSRCSYDQVQAWNFIFKGLLDLWHFTKDVQIGLKQRDEMLQNQYSLFEEQLRPVWFELRQVDESAKRAAGELDIDGSGGGTSSSGFGSALLRFQNRLSSQQHQNDQNNNNNNMRRRSSVANLKEYLEQEDEAEEKRQREKLIKPPLEIRKEVALGVDRLKSFIKNFESDEMSSVTRSFTTTFAEMYLKCDQVWNEQYNDMKKNYQETAQKLQEAQLQVSQSNSVIDEMKKNIEDLKIALEEKEAELKKGNKKKGGKGAIFFKDGSSADFGTSNSMANVGGASGASGGGLNFLPEDDWWSEGSPQLAAALDGVEARFDSLKAALINNSQLAAKNIKKNSSKMSSFNDKNNINRGLVFAQEPESINRDDMHHDEDNNNKKKSSSPSPSGTAPPSFDPSSSFYGISPSELGKLRSELVEDLDQFEKIVHQILRDDNLSQFPEGFVPTACLAKIVRFYAQDCRWLANTLVQNQATTTIRSLAQETNVLLSELKKMRVEMCSNPPASVLLEQNTMPETLLYQRVKNPQITHGLVGEPLRRLFFGFSRLCKSLQNTINSLQVQGDSTASSLNQMSAAAGNSMKGLSLLDASVVMGMSFANNHQHLLTMNANNNSHDATISSKTNNTTNMTNQQQQQQNLGLPFVCSSDVHALLCNLQVAIETCVEEFQTTLIAGSLGQWPTVHKALLAMPSHQQNNHHHLGQTLSQTAASVTTQTTTMMLNDPREQLVSPEQEAGSGRTRIKLGIHSKPILEKAIENALDLALGSQDVSDQLQMMSLFAAANNNHDDDYEDGMYNHHNINPNQLLSAMEGTIRFKPSASKVSSIEEAMKECKMDTVTARLVLHRFEELVLCRGGMAAPFITSSGSSGGNQNQQQEKSEFAKHVEKTQNNKTALDTASAMTTSPYVNNNKNDVPGLLISTASTSAVPSNNKKKIDMFKHGSPIVKGSKSATSDDKTPAKSTPPPTTTSTPSTTAIKRKKSFSNPTASSASHQKETTITTSPSSNNKTSSKTTNSKQQPAKKPTSFRTTTTSATLPQDDQKERKEEQTSINVTENLPSSTGSNNNTNNKQPDFSSQLLQDNFTSALHALDYTTNTNTGTTRNNISAHELLDQSHHENNNDNNTNTNYGHQQVQQQQQQQQTQQQQEATLKFLTVRDESAETADEKQSDKSQSMFVDDVPILEGTENDDLQQEDFTDDDDDNNDDENEIIESDEQQQEAIPETERVVETIDAGTQYDPPALSPGEISLPVNHQRIRSSSTIVKKEQQQQHRSPSVSPSQQQLPLLSPRNANINSASTTPRQQQQQQLNNQEIPSIVVSPRPGSRNTEEQDPTSSLISARSPRLQHQETESNTNVDNLVVEVVDFGAQTDSSLFEHAIKMALQHQQQQQMHDTQLLISPRSIGGSARQQRRPRSATTTAGSARSTRPISPSSSFENQNVAIPLAVENNNNNVQSGLPSPSSLAHEQQHQIPQITIGGIGALNTSVLSNNSSFTAASGIIIPPHHNNSLTSPIFSARSTSQNRVRNSYSSSVVTKTTQVEFDPVVKPIVSDSSCQTEQTTNRQFVVTLPSTSTYSTTPLGIRGALDFHRPPTANLSENASNSDKIGSGSSTKHENIDGNLAKHVEWIPAKWSRSDNHVQLPTTTTTKDRTSTSIIHHRSEIEEDDDEDQENRIRAMDEEAGLGYKRDLSLFVTPKRNRQNVESGYQSRTTPPRPSSAAETWRVGGKNRTSTSPLHRSSIPTIPDSSPASTIRQWKIKGGGGNMFLLKLERDYSTTTAVNNNNNNQEGDKESSNQQVLLNDVPKITSSRRQDPTATMTRKAHTPDSARIFGTPVKYHTPDVRTYQNDIELGDERQKREREEKIEAVRRKMATSPSPLPRPVTKKQEQQRRLSSPIVVRSVFDVSQQLAAELSKIENEKNEDEGVDEQQQHQRNYSDKEFEMSKRNPDFSHQPVINKVDEEAVQTTREMSAFRKKILEKQNYNEEQNGTNVINNNSSSSSAVDSSRPPRQIFLPTTTNNNNNSNNQNTTPSMMKITNSSSASSTLPAIDQDFCREVGLTPLGGGIVKSNPSPSTLRRPASTSSSNNKNKNRMYISREIEKALREKEQRDAKRELLEYTEEKCTKNTNFATSDDHFREARDRIEKEMNELENDNRSLRVQKSENSNQFSNLSHDQVQVQKRKEVGVNLSSLASTLCGPGSLLARKLSSSK